jgi:hypothetical protein
LKRDEENAQGAISLHPAYKPLISRCALSEYDPLSQVAGIITSYFPQGTGYAGYQNY